MCYFLQFRKIYRKSLVHLSLIFDKNDGSKKISANGWFWFLEIYFHNSKRFSRTENYTHAIRCMSSWSKFVKVHFLNFLYDHKCYGNFYNAFSIIMKNFLQPIGLEINSSLRGGSKSENSDWERNALNLKKRWDKNRKKNLFFRTTLLILFNNCEGKCLQIPKMSYLKEEFEYDVLQTLHTAIQEFSPILLC